MADRYYFGDSGNWSDTAHWGTASNGVGAPAAAPTAADDVYFDAASFTIASQTVTVDATAYCKSISFTGATDSPAFAGTTHALNIYGSFTLIVAMTFSFTYQLNFRASDSQTITTAGNSIGASMYLWGAGGTYTLQDAFVSTRIIGMTDGTLVTGNFDITLTFLTISGAGAKTITLGSSTVNCTKWDYTGSNLTLTANTATIKVTGTGAFAGGGITTYNNVELNGTAHTVSGNNTFAKLTRNGTATKTDTLTLPAGGTQIMTTFEPKGNSVTNRLLVQSSTLGTAATVTSTNWTGFQNVDVMDITDTNTEDLSAGSAGDCGGNTGITFTTAAAQISNAAGNWSTLATWQDGAGTDRVPLPQDDVSCSHNVTVDMPRIGKSITFTGTPTITLSNNIENYGSFMLPSGCTYTHANKTNYFRGRDSYTLTANGKTLYNATIVAPLGTITLGSHVTVSNVFTMTTGTFVDAGYIVTLSATGAVFKWTYTAGTVTLTGTIILTNSGVTGQTFAGGSQTYNHVRVEGAGAYTLTITGDNTFEKLRNDSSVAVKTITLTPASTQTIRKLQVFSSAANVAVFNTGGAAATIQKHRGYCEVSHVSLTSIVAGEKYKYYADRNSTDGTGNTNWIFTHKARYVEVD